MKPKGKAISIESNKFNKTSNELDSIFGDKVIDIERNRIRKNNFENLIGIASDLLCRESVLYNVINESNNYYLLKQKKGYSDARHFNAILKTDNDTVIDFFVFNDFSIIDIVQDGDELLILCDDWDNYNSYWKSKQQVFIIKLDKNFNELWKYQIDNSSNLQAVGIRAGKESYFYEINVITGCHICYSIAELELSNNGKYKSVKEIGLHNSSSINPEKLIEIFKVNK